MNPMRKKERFPGSVVIVFLSTLLLTLTAPFLQASETSPSREETSIKELIGCLWQALGKQDEQAFTAQCTEDWHLVTSRATRITAAQMFDFHRKNMGGFQLTSSNMIIRVTGDAAWATYDCVMQAKRNGEPWCERFIMTNIFIRDKSGHWKSVMMHETRAPKPEEK